MANLTKTTNDLGAIVAGDSQDEFMDGLITVGGAVTLLAGTILARDSVSLKFVPFVKGGATNQNGIPKAVLTFPITSAGAGDLNGRVMIAGNVKKERLIIDADGTGANVDAAVLDQLRDYGINPIATQQLSVLDP